MLKGVAGGGGMSILCLSHVMRYSDAKLGARLVLFVLAEHAHDDGRDSYPSVATICDRTRLTRKAVQSALRRLEGDGEIKRDGVGASGQTRWSVLMGGVEVTPREAATPGGRRSGTDGGVAATPEPSFNRQGNESAPALAADQVPDDFPDELRPHARAAFVVLRAIAEERGAKAISAKALATMIMARPRKPIVKAAHDCAAWMLDNPHVPVRDVLARYRRWLDNEADLARLESLPGEPTQISPSRGGGKSGRRDAINARLLRIVEEGGDSCDAA